jgi:ferrous iron transport protein A
MSHEHKHIQTTLDQVPLGSHAVVVGLDQAHKELLLRLLSLGIVAGGVITVIGSAPFGDPIAIETLGYKLSLRRAEAKSVRVDWNTGEQDFKRSAGV